MTTFLGAMPRYSDCHADSSSDCPTAQFRVQAAAEPSVLPRILDVFAKVTVVPDTFASERRGEEDMEIDIRVAGLDARQADQLASRMRAIVDVDQVLVSVESATQTSERRQA